MPGLNLTTQFFRRALFFSGTEMTRMEKNSAGNLGWTIPNNDTSNNINLSAAAGSGSQTVTLGVPVGTAVGTEYLSLGTSPAHLIP
jgi:hypothetical protein